MAKQTDNPSVASHKPITTGLLSRLACNRSGNTTLIMAAATIPLIGLLGSGFDIGRSYLIKSRLQTACDSGVLAGRRAVVGKAWNAASKQIADEYFDANFQSGRYGAFNQAHAFTSLDGITVNGTASASVPTTLMKIFGRDQTDVAVDCKAIMNLPNTDVMFVLDTTGSMDLTNVGDPVNRITALRNSVTNFHATLEAAKSVGTQVRYGFVPYSSNVNVGMLLKREWMVDNWTYQSRVPAGTTSSSSTGGLSLEWVDSNWNTLTGSSAWVQSSLPLESCNKPDDTVVWGSDQPVAGSLRYYNSSGTEITKAQYDALSADTATAAGVKSVEQVIVSATGKAYILNRTATTCILHTQDLTNFTEELTRTKIWTSTPSSTTTLPQWTYRPVSYDVSGLKGANGNGLMAGGGITAPIGPDHSNRVVNWNGCIEERKTVASASYSPIPGGAFDLNIDLVPDSANDQTRWAPALPGLVFARTSLHDSSQWVQANVGPTTDDYANLLDTDGGAWASCPSPSRKLSAITSGDLATYLNALVPTGGTYHDIGLTWGGRLLSPTGLFAAENATTASGAQITRHLVFMTDGEIDTSPSVYDSYGWPAADRRRILNPTIAPTKAEQDDIVAARTAAMCERIKGMNITVWVIAFGTALTTLLEDCASDGSAFQANSATQLNTAFTEIASKIANLRLSD